MGITAFLAVGAGAAAGAWLRWWLGMLLNPLFPTVPMGTLAANLIGGYLMGVAMGVMVNFQALPAEMRLLIITGFLGGLTTFSTFSGETFNLIARQQYAWAMGAIGLHVIGSLAMTGLGLLSIYLIKS